MTTTETEMFDEFDDFDEEVQAPEKPLWRHVLPWMLMIPMLMFAAGNMFSFQAGGGGDLSNGLSGGSEAPRGQQEILLATYGIMCTLIAARYRRVLQMALNMRVLTALAFLALISMFWSQVPQKTLVRGAYYLLDTLFAYWMVTRLTSAQIRTYFMMLGSVIAASSLFMIFVLPRYGVSGALSHLGAWVGIFSEKNHAGGVCLFMLTPAIDYTRRWSRKRMAYVAVTLLLLFMSQSRTALLAAVLYPLIMFFLHKLKSLQPRLALLICFIIGGVLSLTLLIVVPNYKEILLAVGGDPTLTGRTIVWSHLMESVVQRPLLGYGYYGYWTGLVGESGRVQLALKWGFAYAHDGYLEVVLGTGIVGLTLIVFALLSALKNAAIAFTKSSDPVVAWYTGFILLTVLYNFDEESLYFPHTIGTFLFLVSASGLWLARREVAAEEANKVAARAELAAGEFAYSR